MNAHNYFNWFIAYINEKRAKNDVAYKINTRAFK